MVTPVDTQARIVAHAVHHDKQRYVTAAAADLLHMQYIMTNSVTLLLLMMT